MAIAYLTWAFSLLPYKAKAQSGPVSFVSEWKLKLIGPDLVEEKSFSGGENLYQYVLKRVEDQSNAGYPFAQITFDTLKYPDKNTTEIIAKLDLGPVVLQGDIVQEGDTSLSSILISKALRIKKELPFSNKRFQMVPTLIRQLGFAEMRSNPKLEFFGNQAIIHVNLEKRKANFFTGIIGILPQSENQGGTIVTGNVDVGLVNLFNRGIAFQLKWNRFAPESQKADVKLSIPFLNYNGLGFESDFDLFRQDSTINRRKLDLRINTASGAEWQQQFGYRSLFSSGFENLTGRNKVNISTHSISFTFNKLYPIVNGIDLKKRHFSVSVFPVLKTISRPENSEKTIPQMEAILFWKMPISFSFQRFAIQTSGLIQTVFSDQITLQDQFRTGGNRSVRGFNENFFYTSQHALFSVQPQFLLDRNFMAGVFSDFFLFNSKPDNQWATNLEWAMGFGLATELDLGNNLVQISFANGLIQGIPLDLQTTKIHFGYFARF